MEGNGLWGDPTRLAPHRLCLQIRNPLAINSASGFPFVRSHRRRLWFSIGKNDWSLLRFPANSAMLTNPPPPPSAQKESGNPLEKELCGALSELTLTLHAIRTQDIDRPRSCRMHAAAAFIRAACAQLDSKGVLAAYSEPPRPSPHGAERDWA